MDKQNAVNPPPTPQHIDSEHVERWVMAVYACYCKRHIAYIANYEEQKC